MNDRYVTFKYLDRKNKVTKTKKILGLAFIRLFAAHILPKGFVKIRNFRKNPKKLNYIHVLTPKGIAMKTKLTINFMKRKMAEYDQLKKELNQKK